MRNKKLDMYKELFEDALSLLDSQEKIERDYDFDLDYVKHKENECIIEFSAKLAAINQLAFQQINHAKILGTIVINQHGFAEAV